MNMYSKAFPWIVLSLGVIYVAWLLAPARDPGPTEFDLGGFGAIPVLHNGRVKPMDTLARSYLTLLTHKQTFVEEIDTGKKDDNGKPIIEEKRRPAIRWLLDIMVALPFWEKKPAFGGPAADHKILRIENEEVLSLMGLPERPGSWRYSVGELKKESVDKLQIQAKRAFSIRKNDPSKLTQYDAKVLELADHLQTILKLANFEIPQGVPMGNQSYEQWQSLEFALNAGGNFLQRDAASRGLLKALLAYADNDPKAFNASVRELHAVLKHDYANDSADVGIELVFNRFEPFHQATVFYLFAILLACLSWLGWSQPLSRAAVLLTILGFIIHTWGILARMYILGRPPVINLYSSAVFIGWCCVGVCLVMEYVYRNCIPLVAGTVLASVTCGIIGHYLSLDGDTLEMLQAVLDTNFWLATHVTSVTFGYGATLFAGILGIFSLFYRINTTARILAMVGLTLLTGAFYGVFGFILFGVCAAILVVVGTQVHLKSDEFNNLAKMTYGIVCFATLLSFVGTVLGGIWADQSWGRFWGWDPKENGALLIVIWNALILHARWGGMVKAPGIALLAIAGNIVVGWSYFGTNLLGVGLHAYGFKSGTKIALIYFSLTQLFLIAVGLVPQRFWLNLQNIFMPPVPPAKDGDASPPPRMSVPSTVITTPT